MIKAKKFFKWYILFAFGLTVIPYIIVKIPPFTDYIGHLYFAFYSGGIYDAYRHEFHLSYQLVDSLLSILRMVFQTPEKTSVIFFILNSILVISIFYLLLKTLGFNKKIIIPFIFLYPLGQFSSSYYWGFLPFVTSSMFWALFILLYLNSQEKNITFKLFILLVIIEFLTFFSHPLSSLFIILALITFFLKAIINKEKKNIIYLILFLGEILLLSYYFKMSLPSRFDNSSITSIFITKDFLNTIFSRFFYAIFSINNGIFSTVPGIKGAPLSFLSLLNSFSHLSSLILIYITFRKFSIKSSKFYFVLIIFLLSIIFFIVVDFYDQASMLPMRVLDYYEIFRFGGLLYLISLLFNKKVVTFIEKHLALISLTFGFFSLFFVYSFINQDGNINNLVVSTVTQILSCTASQSDRERVLYNYNFHGIWFKHTIPIAASLDDQLKNKNIVIKNDWAEICAHCPVVWNNSYDTNRTVVRRLSFDYDKDIVRVNCN